MILNTEKLMNGRQLLESLFSEECRPTERWLWTMRKERKVPFIKFGHFVLFDPLKVRAALERNCEVRAR